MVDFIAAVLAAGSVSGTQQQQGLASQATTSLATARRLVLDHGAENVARDLQQHIHSTSPTAVKAVKAVLSALRSSALGHTTTAADAEACAQLRSALFGQLPSWVQQIPTDGQQLAADLITAVMPDVDSLGAEDLAALMTAVLSSMEQKQPRACTLLELLPVCLAALQAAPGPATSTQAAAAANAADEADEEAAAGAAAGGAVEAAKHRDAAVHRLCHCQWQPEQVCQILSVLKGLALTSEQLKSVLAKAIRACRNAGLQQLPPILYQVLLLSGNTPGMRCYALRLIISLFGLLEANQGGNSAAAAGNAGNAEQAADPDGQQEQQQEQQQQEQAAAATLPSATLMQVQATLLMHVSTMLRYDAALGNEWVKWVSGEAGVTSTNYFLLQVLLTMSRQPKHEQTVLQLLKRRIVQACEEQAAGGSSGGSSTGGGCNGWMVGLQQVNTCPSINDLQQGLIKAIRCSSYASELVAPGLLQLADMLISTRCSSPLHVVLAMKGGAGSLPPQAPACARAVVLGLQLLQELFAVHAEARGEVLKVVQAKLASNDLSAALPIVLLLGSITQQQPALLSDYLSQLKDCMASFAGLSSDTAMSLLLAVWPLCRVRSDLQDFVVMLLRKMMYRQDVDGRLIATRGFLRLICQHLQDSPLPQPVLDPSAASCSQASLSQRASLSSSKGVNLLQELTGVLRRALGQQVPVREALYEGILQILAADPASAELLAELLLPHLCSFMVEDQQQLPPLLIHKCAQLTQGSAALVEPLAALLSCVYRLTRTVQQPPAAIPVSGPSLGGSENWMGPGADGEDQQEQSTSQALKACFDSIRVRMGQCQLDHFELPCAADMSPMQPDGLLGQLHAGNLLGTLQVVIEAAVADVTRMIQRQTDANQRDGDAVNKLGAELMQLFYLHSELYQLAMDGSKAGSKKGRKPAGAAAAAGEGPSQPSTAPAVGQKRPRPSDAFTPVNKQRPRFSAPCLAQLCMAIVDDGLMQLPSSYDVSNPDHHAQLARDAGFRACVLRSCTSLLEDAQAAAASALLLHNGAQEGDGAPAPAAAAEVLELGPALYKVARLVMSTATAGGRSTAKPTSSSSGGGEGRKAASAAASAGEGSETLEHLSAIALLQLVKLADATQQLKPLFVQLPLDDGSLPEQGGADSSSGSAAGDAAAEVAAAVMPRLPQLLACTDSLLQQGCFKEAQVMVECLSLLGRRLVAPVPAAASGQQQQQQQQQQPQQPKEEPAYAALSRWAHKALQQQEPEVKSVPLVRGLLELYIRCHGKDCVVALKTAMQAINEVVGDTDGSTQSTQEHGTILPMLVGGKTAQPAALTPLGIINEGLEQLEKLTAANLKGGVFQDGDGASVAKSRRKLAAAVCKRLQDLLACLRVLVGTVVAMPVVIDQQTRVATRAYKLLATLAKAYQIPKRPAGQPTDVSWALSPEFEALVGYVHKDLTSALNHALKDLGTEDTSASLARVKKDAKLLPAFVYAVEEWERKLVSTGKSASKNLLRDAKRSFCRDFKVKAPPGPPPGQQQQQQHAAAAAAAAGAGGARAQANGAKPRAAQGGTSQQRPAGSRGSGASGGGAGSSRQGGSSGAGSGQEHEEEDDVMADEDEDQGPEDEDMGEGGDEEEGGEAYEENEQQQQQQQHHKNAGRAAAGGIAGRAPLQRRQD